MIYGIRLIKTAPMTTREDQVKTIRGYEVWCEIYGRGPKLHTDINEAYRDRNAWNQNQDTADKYIVEEYTEAK